MTHKLTIYLDDKTFREVMERKEKFEARTGCHVSITTWITAQLIKPKEVNA